MAIKIGSKIENYLDDKLFPTLNTKVTRLTTSIKAKLNKSDKLTLANTK